MQRASDTALVLRPGHAYQCLASGVEDSASVDGDLEWFCWPNAGPDTTMSAKPRNAEAPKEAAAKVVCNDREYHWLIRKLTRLIVAFSNLMIHCSGIFFNQRSVCECV